jgi:mRNA interferase RelE/StbE
MGYRVEILAPAEKALGKFDKQTRERAFKFLNDELPKLENPRTIGEALSGKLSEYWKYRRGSLRFVCQIKDERILILVLKIGDRKEVYKKK